MDFADVLRKLREEKGLSQMEVSKKTGISHSAIARWELSQAQPTAQYLLILSDFFNVSVDYLLGKKEF